jgi:hypothetical protein
LGPAAIRAFGGEFRWAATACRIPRTFTGCPFRILSTDGGPPGADRDGWKDAAPASAGGSAEILLRFAHSAAMDDPDMARCDILEQEDSGMMAQFTVSSSRTGGTASRFSPPWSRASGRRKIESLQNHRELKCAKRTLSAQLRCRKGRKATVG